ncbi:LCP family protein [Streptomyces sp. NPDC048659]|uniref:LCP family protein n=1 Tax=Streptomyces sp. NPDC048659 TaxID=3155489 RepID=UPI003440BE2D
MKFPRPGRLVLLSTALVALATGSLALAPSDLPSPTYGLNLLVVGTDVRAGVTAEEKERYRLGSAECACTDVIMLVHVSAKNDRVSVVSLPRDSLTTFPAGHVDRRTGEEHDAHLAKINHAWAEGGPALAIEIAEATTGVPVHRYLEIDFRRFMDTVNHFDKGVPVCTKTRLKDPVTGIDLRAGTTPLRGGPALQYVRSRRADGKMDFGRIQKQQLFVANALRNVRDGLLRDPKALRALAATLRGTAKAERGISVPELVTLAGRLRNVTPARTEFATVPIAGFNEDVEDVGSTLAWDDDQATEVFGALRTDRPLPKAKPKPTSDIPQGLGDYRPVRGDKLLCK